MLVGKQVGPCASHSVLHQMQHIVVFLKKNIYLFTCTGSWLWHVGSSSPARDQTPAPCIESSES